MKSLTTYQIKLIKRSWLSLSGINPALIADIFYSKLFTDHPRLRKLFPLEMEQQYKKLMDMLTSIVTRIDELHLIDHELSAMAQRHVGYGTQPAHYQAVGKALLWTLEKGLGKAWTPELREAWEKCYTILADKMQSAGHS